MLDVQTEHKVVDNGSMRVCGNITPCLVRDK